MIYLTSFREARGLPNDVAAFSGARWAPSFARLWPKVEWAAPIRPDGSAIKLRDFGEQPLPKYREYMLELYRMRWPQIREWLQDRPEKVAICCWCPYTKTARAQIERFGSFHCHLAVVAEVLDACEVEAQLHHHGAEIVRHTSTAFESTNRIERRGD